MNRSPIQRNLSRVLVGLIFLFAATSTGNLAEFIEGYHKGWTGWTLGVCFGVTLFVSAYIAATAKTKQTRLWALTIGCVFGLASATFQTVLYMHGDAPWFVAVPLAFVPIVAGEVGLALMESSYSKEHGEEELSAQAQGLKTQLENLQTQYGKVLTDSEFVQTQLEDVKKRSEEDRRTSEGLRTQLEQAEKESENLRSQLESLRQQLNYHTVDSVLNRLDDGKREKFSKLLETVETERVQSPADLVRLEALNKSDAYALWPIATATALVYLNGDGAYHVKRFN